MCRHLDHNHGSRNSGAGAEAARPTAAEEAENRLHICGPDGCICGYTACPPHPKLAKASMGAEDIVDTIHFDTAVEAVCHYKAKGFKVFGVDTISEADVIWEFKVDGPIAIVLGNEALGIQEETLNGCDGFIKLPAYGLKNSINVSNCAAVVLFDLAKQFIT